MTNLLDLLRRDFLEYLEIEKGRSLNTIAHSDRHLQRFLARAAETSPNNPAF